MPKLIKPAYLLHKATGQARCRINRKDHYLGRYGSPESREKYDELVAEWFARNGDTSRHDLTIDPRDEGRSDRSQVGYRGHRRVAAGVEIQ